jgi:hypothetical protein
VQVDVHLSPRFIQSTSPSAGQRSEDQPRRR